MRKGQRVAKYPRGHSLGAFCQWGSQNPLVPCDPSPILPIIPSYFSSNCSKILRKNSSCIPWWFWVEFGGFLDCLIIRKWDPQMCTFCTFLSLNGLRFTCYSLSLGMPQRHLDSSCVFECLVWLFDGRNEFWPTLNLALWTLILLHRPCFGFIGHMCSLLNWNLAFYVPTVNGLSTILKKER